MNETSRPPGGPPRLLLSVADVRDILARLVAAREEQALGKYDQAAAILGDLEADLAALAARLDAQPRR